LTLQADWTENPFANTPSDDAKGAEAFDDPSIAAATTEVPEYNPFDGTPAPDGSAVSDGPPTWATKTAAAENKAKGTAKNAVKPKKKDKVTKEESERLNAYAANENNAEQGNKDPNYRPANWPPFPGFCKWPCHPCFHHDFRGEIPDWGYTTLKRTYQMWLVYFFILFYNMIACFASLGCEDCDSVGSQAGFAVLWFFVFSPASYLCWFQPLYQAMRKDSSLRFGWFFLNAGIQFIFGVIATVGLEGSGHSGFIASFVALGGDGGDKVIGIIMITAACLWLIFTLYTGYILQRVLQLYRSTGQSLDKAQNEAVVGAVSSKAGRSAVKGAVKASL